MNPPRELKRTTLCGQPQQLDRAPKYTAHSPEFLSERILTSRAIAPRTRNPVPRVTRGQPYTSPRPQLQRNDDVCRPLLAPLKAPVSLAFLSRGAPFANEGDPGARPITRALG